LDKGVFTAVSGAAAQEQRLQTLANNIANVDTIAYKKDEPVFKEFVASLEKQETVIDVPRVEFKPSDFYHLHGNDKSYVSLDDIVTNNEQGTLHRTANPMDFAIQGEGYFEVNTPIGVRYTRAGNFTLDAKMRLVTLDGYPVLSALKKADPNNPNADIARLNMPENREIVIRGQDIQARPDGTLVLNGAELTKLRVTEFENRAQLQRAGRNLFAALPEAAQKPTVSSSVQQGYVEKSNVNPVQEMVDLITTQRTFDGLQNAIRAYSDMAAKGTNTIGDMGGM
jgi:flagellar basal-body rod protein FlgF